MSDASQPTKSTRSAFTEGVVKAFVPAKRFGFINGADGKTYFFHANDFVERLADGAVLDGALVTFDATPTPKGLAAKRLKIAKNQAIEWCPPGDFLMIRDDEPKRGRIVAEVSAITLCDRGSPDEIRLRLRRLAAEMGANALVGLAYRKDTGSEGNYNYTVHVISGRPAVIMEPRLTGNLAAVEASERRCDEMAAALEQGYEKYLADLAERERRRRARIRLWLVVLAVMGLFVAWRFA